MNFLAPLYLVLAVAAGIPLLLHLMRRNVGARVDFPAARYLQRAEQEHSRSLRLRNLMLMLLRVLLVVVLALAAARPFLPGLGVGHGPTAVAIVLDNSLSTTALADGAPVFERLRAATGALLRAATPADRLWLVSADGRVRGGTREQLLAELARITPSEGAGDLALALRRAAAATAAANLPVRSIAVATDGQRTAWATAVRVPGRISVLVPPGEPPANRAVVDAATVPPRWTPRGTITARIEASDSVAWRILIGDRTLARGSGGMGIPVAVRAAPPERGWQAGRVELERDDFRADDVQHFALWIGAPPAVSVDAGAGTFVTTAANALAADGRIALSPGGGARIASADVLMSLPALVLPPTDPVRLGAANRSLARLGIPWRYGVLRRGPGIVRGTRLDGVGVTERYLLRREPGAESDTLATAAGEPWIVAGDGYVLMGSRLDPAATTLPLRAAFVPWLAETLALRLGGPAGESGAPVRTRPGAPVRLAGGVDAMESAAGARRAVSGTATHAPDERGVWFMLRRGRRVGALVVNAPAEESALARWSAPVLAARLGGRDRRAAGSGDEWVRSAFTAGSSRPALVPLLVTALLLLAAEAAVVRSTRSSRSIA